MSAPPVKPAIANCRKKLSYPSEIEARGAAMYFADHFGHKAMWVYRCPVCHRWHMTRLANNHRWKVTPTDPYPPREAA